MATITEMIVKIGADVSAFERNMSRTQGHLQDTFGRMSSVGRTMTAAITTPLVGAGVAAVMTGAKFDTSMSKVAAVTGATGKDFKILRDKAKEMGRTTQFSASESAEAMSYLGMAGFDTKQIMTSVGDVMNLAAAGQIDLARAADISSNVLTGFGLKAEDMGRVSDVMAKGAASANTNIEQLGYAMSYAAPIASSMGWSLEESTAAIGMFSNAGIQGEKAGTALRGIIASLSNPTGQTAEKLKQLGLSAEDVNPKTNSLADILKKLEGAGMDSSEAMELVGVEAGPALAALMKQGTGELEKFTTKLENSKGAGKKMAKTMQDNVGGSFKGLMSAVEAVALSFYDQWEPAIRAGTEVLRDLATWISDLSPTTVTLISAIGGMVAIAGPLLWAIGSLGNALPGIVVGFKSVMGAIKIARVAFLAFNTTLFTTPIGWIILGIAAVVAAIVLLWKNWDTVTAFLGECWEAIKGMATAFFEPIAEFISEIWSSIKDATMNIWNGIKDFLAEWGTTLLAILFPGFGLILAMIIENWDAVKAGTVAVWNAIKAFFAPIIQWFVGIVKTSWNAIKAVTVPVWNAIKAVLVAVWNGIKAVVSPIISWFVGIIKSSWNIIKSVTSTVFNAVKSVISTVWNAMKSTIGTTIKGITTVVKDGFRLVRSIILATWIINGETHGPYPCTSGNPIPYLNNRLDISGATLEIEARLETDSNTKSPALSRLQLEMEPGYMVNVDGERIAPGVEIGSVGVVGFSRIWWEDENPDPSKCSIHVFVSDAEAGPWMEVENGALIPGAEPGTDVTGKTLYVRTVLRTNDPTLTPRLQVIGWEVSQETKTDLINEGTAPADAIFFGTFSSSADYVQILHIQSGRRITLNYPFEAGDEVEMDCELGRVKINGSARDGQTAMDFSSRWIELHPGYNSFEVTPSGVGEFFCEWKERWL